MTSPTCLSTICAKRWARKSVVIPRRSSTGWMPSARRTTSSSPSPSAPIPPLPPRECRSSCNSPLTLEIQGPRRVGGGLFIRPRSKSQTAPDHLVRRRAHFRSTRLNTSGIPHYSRASNSPGHSSSRLVRQTWLIPKQAARTVRSLTASPLRYQTTRSCLSMVPLR